MRKVFTLLVSSCIGLVCGFIVPSSIPEFLDEDAAILAENDATKQDEMKLSTIDPGFVVIPDGEVLTNVNDINLEKVREINDNALYENPADKENNLNERSYVYINQKFKSPARKGFHRPKQLENNTQTNKVIIPPMAIKETINEKPLATKLSYGFFQPSVNEKIVKDVNDNYILSNNKCDDCSKGIKAHGLQHRKYNKHNSNNKGIDDELNYIELLKPPYVRNVNNNEKIKYPNMKDFASALVLNTNHYNDKEHSNSEIPSTVVQKELLKRIDNIRRMHSLQKVELGNNEIPQKEDNLIFDDNIMGKTDQTYTPLEETPEERQEMDRFQKNTYGEQVTHEKVSIDYEHCNYKDCVQTNKKRQRNVKSKCKCPVKITLKGNNTQQERLGKGKIKTNKTNAIMNVGDRRLSEYSDYDNILVENASRNIDDELMKTVNKLNYTLQMYR